MPKFVLLWTDAAIWLLVACMAAYAVMVLRTPNLRGSWHKVFRDPAALASSVILLLCLCITLVDSLHYRPLLPPAPGTTNAAPAYEARVCSVLDAALWDLVQSRESTYSHPLAIVSWNKDSVQEDGQIKRVAPRLKFGGSHVKDPQDHLGDVLSRAATGAVAGLAVAALLCLLLVAAVARARRATFGDTWHDIRHRHGLLPWHVVLWTLLVLGLIVGPSVVLSGPYHLLGTDRTGNDVLYQALKSIRTAFVIGGLATLATLPLAVTLGIMAGYFKGWVDELIQYIYTVLSSVPNVLLIAACVLMVQVFLDKHPELFETGAERADLKLFLLCAVLGATGWAGLCRLLRGETMKLRELDYVQAAHAFGVGHTRIMLRHIFPNVAHLMLIVTVLEFSALILYEAVLSYVGVGVDPSMNSFGGMINLARSEMARDPVVWWSFAAAFGFMVTLVLAANLFADGVRDAFDPRARSFRPRRQTTPRTRSA
jgi:peptide/nickel transport system permease protein